MPASVSSRTPVKTRKRLRAQSSMIFAIIYMPPFAFTLICFVAMICPFF